MESQFSCTRSTLAAIEKNLSKERFRRYVLEVNGDKNKALRLYLWNARLSEAFYSPLQSMEITLRNTIHKALVSRFGNNWPFNPKFQNNLTQYTLQELLNSIGRQKRRRRQRLVTTSEVVADLPFGFWLSMLSAGMDIHVWQFEFAKTFPNFPIQPNGLKTVRNRTKDLKEIRNRIAHHEPIYHLPLRQLHDEALELTGWVSRDTRWWMNETSRVIHVLGQDPR